MALSALPLPADRPRQGRRPLADIRRAADHRSAGAGGDAAAGRPRVRRASLAALALATPSLSLIGAVGAALVLGARRGGSAGAAHPAALHPAADFAVAAIDAAAFGLPATCTRRCWRDRRQRWRLPRGRRAALRQALAKVGTRRRLPADGGRAEDRSGLAPQAGVRHASREARSWQKTAQEGSMEIRTLSMAEGAAAARVDGHHLTSSARSPASR